tara:strand:+ start:5714 stop:5965 length:252 start_codon:yes stop_codon:yes gene_type:complete
MRYYMNCGAGTGVGIKRWPGAPLRHLSASFPRSFSPALQIITTGGIMGYRFTGLTTACQQDWRAYIEYDVGLLRSAEMLPKAM